MVPEVSCPEWAQEEELMREIPLVASEHWGLPHCGMQLERPRSFGLPRRFALLLTFVAVAAFGVAAGWRSSLGRWWHAARPSSSRSDGLEALFGVSDGPGAANEPWEVIWPTGVNVRHNSDFSSHVVDVQRDHNIVYGTQEGNWLKLENGKGFMAIKANTTGILLRKLDKKEVKSRGEERTPPPPRHPHDGGSPRPAEHSAPRPAHAHTTARATTHRPTPRATTPRPPTTTKPTGSCKAYGCVGFNPANKCQCNDQCKQHGSCCSDYQATCVAAPTKPPACDFKYNYTSHGPAQCFCHLARNSGCRGKCPCPQGCDDVTWPVGRTVTFKNLALAKGCPNPQALLTVPQSYFADIEALRKQCPTGMKDYLSDLLRAGFEQYQKVVAKGPVKQCIHAAGATSQAWLHVHTICPGGSIDRMWETNEFYWCGILNAAAAADVVAQQAATWAMQMKDAHKH